jgi:hypothetical protein
MPTSGWTTTTCRIALLSSLMLGLSMLADSPPSQTPLGVLGLFGFSLFVSLGFLLFGQQRFPSDPAPCQSDDEHLA